MIIRLAVFIFASILILLQCLAGDDSASMDGSFPLENGTITIITDYNRMDQCMAQPGYFHVHHNSLVIFLEKHQFCGGGPHGTEGFLSCYKGQLDENETLRKGLKPNRQFELKNVPGNAVAKRCEEAGHPGWHGMLIYTNDQGEWVIKFSTTNRTFVISGASTERPELLVYKMASAKDGGESFLSKIFGPKRDFMDWSKDNFGVAEEAANRIRNDVDEQLKKLFMELVKHQALLRNYVGIWSLGLDMLPTDENVYHLELYTEKSECCKAIQTFFNLPTAEYPDPKKEEVQFDDDNNEPIVMDGNFIENFNGTLDGIVGPNTKKNLSFELVDLLHPSDKDQGMRLIVDFEQTRIIFERMEDKNWVFVNKTEGFKYHFAAGVAFHLFFIMRKNELIVNMNCYGPVPLPAVGEIDFKNLHRIKIDGDFQLTKEFFVQSYHLDNSWLISNNNGTIFGISADNSSGIVLRGKVDDENAKYFSIKLWTREGDGFFETIFELKVNILGLTIQYSDGSKDVFEDAFEKGKQPKYDDAGSPFEVLVQFNNETFDIWMNNTKIRQQYNTTAGFGVVNYVQILGDASGDLIQLQKTPMECKFKMSDDKKDAEHTLNITGKVLPGSKGKFYIELKSGVGTEDGDNSPLFFSADLNDQTVSIIQKIGRGKIPENKIPEFKDLLKIGEDFHLKFQYRENAKEILVAFNGAEYIFKSPRFDFAPTKQYKISGDIIVLDELSTPCDPILDEPSSSTPVPTPNDHSTST